MVPANRPSQKETSIPTINSQGRTVSCRECIIFRYHIFIYTNIPGTCLIQPHLHYFGPNNFRRFHRLQALQRRHTPMLPRDQDGKSIHWKFYKLPEKWWKLENPQRILQISVLWTCKKHTQKHGKPIIVGRQLPKQQIHSERSLNLNKLMNLGISSPRCSL